MGTETCGAQGAQTSGWHRDTASYLVSRLPRVRCGAGMPWFVEASGIGEAWVYTLVLPLPGFMTLSKSLNQQPVGS